MSTITTRAGKGSPLTNNEVDANFTNLNADKAELSGATFTGEITANGGIALGDGDVATFGDSDDLSIQHAGGTTYLTNTTGSLVLRSDSFRVLNTANSEQILHGDANGAVTAYYDNSAKLATTATGIDVTGTATMDGLTVDQSSDTTAKLTINNTTSRSTAIGYTGTYQLDIGASGTNDNVRYGVFSNGGATASILTNAVTRALFASNGDISFYEDTGTTAKLTWDASAESLNFADNGKATFGASDNLQIYSDGTNSFIKEIAGAGSLIFNADFFTVQNAAGTETKLVAKDNAEVQLYYDNLVKLATTSTGIDVTGTATIDGLVVESTLATIGLGGTANQAAELRLEGTSNAANGAYLRGRRGGSSSFLIGDTAGALGSGTGLINYVYGANPWLVYTNATERMRIDSAGNVGIGVVPESWTYFSPIQAKRSSFAGSDGQTGVGYNWYFDGAYKYIANDYALAYQQNATSGVHTWSTAASGTADNTISWSESMRIDSAGNLALMTDGADIKLYYTEPRTFITNSGASVTIKQIDNDGTNAYIDFASWTNSSLMRLMNNGNLLVGTSVAPNTLLGASATQGLAFNGGSGYLVAAANNTPTAYFNRQGTDGTIADFRKNGTTVGSIGTVAGRLGIGTGDAGLFFDDDNNKISPVTMASGTPVDSNGLLDLGYSLARFKDLWVSRTHIANNSTSYWTLDRDDNDGSLRFDDTGTERMRIDPSGSLLVGATNISASADEGIKLRVGNSAKTISTVSANSTSASEGFTMWSTGASAWRFYVGWDGTIHATSTSIAATSDERLKENIVDLETGLTEVMALKPRRFDWKNGDGENIAGFVAQEVETVLPDLVVPYKHEDFDAKGLKMGDMLPTLVKAIQEQQTLIESLTARIAALEE